MVKNLEGEVWKVHPKWNWMAASNLGRVKSLERDILYKNGAVHHYEEKLIEPYPNENGYLQFKIRKNGKVLAQPMVHRFVFECMNQVIIPKGMLELQINHRNEIKTDNRIENLELVTPKENINYGSRNEKVSKTLTNRSDQSKQVAQYDLEGNLIKIWKSTAEAERNGFSHGHVAACCRGKRKTHKDSLWKYI